MYEQDDKTKDLQASPYLDKNIYFQERREWNKVYRAELEKFLLMTTGDLHLVSRDWLLMTTGTTLISLKFSFVGCKIIEIDEDNTQVVAEDTVNQHIYKVIDGTVKVVTGVKRGTFEEMGEYGPGSFFGELSMLSSKMKTSATLVSDFGVCIS